MMSDYPRLKWAFSLYVFANGNAYIFVNVGSAVKAGLKQTVDRWSVSDSFAIP